MNKSKLKLAELNNTCNSKKKKSASQAILLFIAQSTAETNGNVKLLCWIASIGIAAGITTLIAFAMRGI